MHGSPTLMVDGADPFARPCQQPALACRLYRQDDGSLALAPTVGQLYLALTRSAFDIAGHTGAKNHLIRRRFWPGQPSSHQFWPLFGRLKRFRRAKSDAKTKSDAKLRTIRP
jgi:hypothetical protein